MLTLLEEAAAEGYHFAQFRLGEVLLSGAAGIDRDAMRALELFEAAGAQGNAEARAARLAAMANPSSVTDDPAAQLDFLRIAAREGSGAAIAAIGVAYETGRGVVKKPAEAAAWYLAALEAGVAFEALRKGAPGWWDYDTAREFQMALKDLGYYEGWLDGQIGPQSMAAAKAFARGDEPVVWE